MTPGHSPTPPSSEATLGQRLTRLHHAHYARLVRIWAARCPSRDDAEDLVQDGFARLYRRYQPDRLPVAIPDDAVLLRILHVTLRNLLIDHYRHTAAERDHDALARAPDQLSFDPDQAQHPGLLRALRPIDWDHPVEDVLAARQLLDRLLDRLDPHWARVLSLLCDDFSPAEIGAAMEGRNGHVLVRRAREHICRLLGDFAAAGDRAAAWMAARFCGLPDRLRPDQP